MDYPYGEERWSLGTLPTDYRFTDQRREPQLAIYHMGARWFDSYLSRWLSADSIVPDPSDPQSLNRYSWVRGDPVKFRDPTGHQAEPVAEALRWAGTATGTAALTSELCVAAPVVLLGGVVVVVFVGGGAFSALWVIEGPLGPSYPLPEELDPANPFGATYPLPESSTLFIDSTMFFAMPKGVKSMADHLGFLFGYGSAGLPGFPDPFDRHDPKKTGSDKNSGQHIRNALEGIKKNLGRQDLGSYLQQTLSDKQYTSLTQGLDDLVWDLQHQGYLYEQFGDTLSSDILTLLRDMGYIVGP